jgi:hypothetical protein
LGPGIAGLPGRRRQQGLFIAPQEREALEFGYCFDVSVVFWIVGKETDVSGFHQSILPCMGVALCGTICGLAFDKTALLVRLQILQ